MPIEISLWKKSIYDFKNIKNIKNIVDPRITMHLINIIQPKKQDMQLIKQYHTQTNQAPIMQKRLSEQEHTYNYIHTKMIIYNDREREREERERERERALIGNIEYTG